MLGLWIAGRSKSASGRLLWESKNHHHLLPTLSIVLSHQGYWRQAHSDWLRSGSGCKCIVVHRLFGDEPGVRCDSRHDPELRARGLFMLSAAAFLITGVFGFIMGREPSYRRVREAVQIKKYKRHLREAKDTVTISFANEQYAELFRRLNAAVVLDGESK